MLLHCKLLQQLAGDVAQSNRPHLWWQVKATLVHTGGDSSRSVGEALCNYVAKVKPAALLMMKVRVLESWQHCHTRARVGLGAMQICVESFAGNKVMLQCTSRFNLCTCGLD